VLGSDQAECPIVIGLGQNKAAYRSKSNVFLAKKSTKAKKQYLPGYVWHIAHRCHKKEFLLKFARDRRKYMAWFFEEKGTAWDPGLGAKKWKN